MTHPTTDWSTLSHAAGPADDIPALFARLDGGPGDKEIWDAIWSDLYHQGSVYGASFAALPLLADVATGRSAGDRVDAVSLAGFIVGEAEPEDRRRHEDEIAELLTVCRECMAQVPADDPKEFVYFVQFLLAFEGVPFWGAELERLVDEFEAECPECEALTEVMVGEYLDDCTAVFHPADPGLLTGIGARLHAMALRAGQDEAAEWLARLFGRVTCAECETVFDLAESAARA
ncbi:hypothetical protein ABZ490_25645 [Streptomyces sp. NPDC005811]|uniref:hypothetical protein n=1 Tax=Streptomyces sp. NPDC005811 TaxID=3154565 RepID=UPI00340ABEAE